MKNYLLLITTVLAIFGASVINSPDVVAQSTYSIFGQVVDENGAAMSGLSILLIQHDQGSNKTATTNSSGYYTFADLPAGQDYTVAPQSLDDFEPSSQRFDNLQGNKTQNFTKVVETYSIFGQVVDENGSAMSGLSILLIRHDQSSNITATTNSSGYYTFADLPAGQDYTVAPQSLDDFEPSSQRFDNLQGNKTQNFTRIVNYYSIFGQVVDENGVAMSNLSMMLIKHELGTSTIVNTNSSGNYTFSDLPAGQDYTVVPQSFDDFDPESKRFDNLQSNQTQNFAKIADPTLSVNPSSLSFGEVEVGLSSTKSYVLTANNLSGDLTISVPEGFQISTSSTTWLSGSIKLTPVQGSIEETVDVRFTPTTEKAYSGVIAHSATGVNSASVSVSGTGFTTPDPALSVNLSSLSFGEVEVGQSSTKNYVLTGSNLTDDVSISAPEGYLLSTPTLSSNNNSLNLTPTNGSIEVTINVQFNPVAVEQYSGAISNSSSGANSISVAVNGAGISTPEPTMVVNPSSLSFGEVEVGQSNTKSYELTVSNLTENVSISAPEGYQLSTSTMSTYSSTITLPSETGTRTINVRFTPTSSLEYSGNITHNSTGANTATVALNGSGASVPTSGSITVSTNEQVVLSEAYSINVLVGSPDPVEDLYGVSFKLTFDDLNTTCSEGTASAGDFLGDDVIFFPQKIDDQTYDIAITKKSSPGSSGEGIVASIECVSSEAGQVIYSLQDIAANDSEGNNINLESSDLEISVIETPKLNVWPGDHNNDGTVNSKDLLPLGLYYGQERPGENNPGRGWQGYEREPWETDGDTPKRVYADGDGDGLINSKDVLPIGLNYGKTHDLAKSLATSSTGSPAAEGKLILELLEEQGQQAIFGLYLDVDTPVYGFSAKLDFEADAASVTSFNATVPQSMLGNDALVFSEFPEGATYLDVAATRTQQGPQQDGYLMQLVLTHSLDSGDKLLLHPNDVIVMTPDGEELTIEGERFSYTAGLLEASQRVSEVPEAYELYDNYPNPFNPVTQISYSLPEASQVRLSVYSMTGQLIKVLVSERQKAGEHQVAFNAEHLSSGVYLYRLETSTYTATKKLTLIK